jgi:tyrosine-protein kinase
LEIRQYINIVRRWWWLIGLLSVVGGVAAFAASYLGQSTYESSTTVLINQAPGALPSADAVLSGQRVAATYAELLHQRPILQEVITNLGLKVNPEDLDKQIRITPVRDTNLLVVYVRDTNPDQAARIANEIVRVFIEQNLNFQTSRYAASLESLQNEMTAAQADIDRTETTLRTLDNATTPEQIAQQTRLQDLLTQQRTNYTSLLDKYEEIRLAQTQTTDKVAVVEEALPGTPVQNVVTVLLLGVVVGLFVGFGSALAIESIRGSIRTVEELEEISGVPTLGTIGRISVKTPDEALITVTKPRSPIAEAYRVLNTNIRHNGADQPLNTLVISSCTPGEGKSTTAANLAVAMAQSGSKVILVDSDLRRPSLHKLFHRENSRGLSTALLATNGYDIRANVIKTDIENLALMPSGPLPPNPAELLGSQRMVDLVTLLAKHADIVVFDSPPIMALADTRLVMRLCDAIVLVVQSDLTRPDALLRARNDIVQNGAHLTGTVLNKISASADGYYNYYYRKYGGQDVEE